MYKGLVSIQKMTGRELAAVVSVLVAMMTIAVIGMYVAANTPRNPLVMGP